MGAGSLISSLPIFVRSSRSLTNSLEAWKQSNWERNGHIDQWQKCITVGTVLIFGQTTQTRQAMLWMPWAWMTLFSLPFPISLSLTVVYISLSAIVSAVFLLPCACVPSCIPYGLYTYWLCWGCRCEWLVDTIPGRQCMASCFFLLKQFQDVLIYLQSVKVCRECVRFSGRTDDSRGLFVELFL